jgi:predicted nucleic acid-binding protein
MAVIDASVYIALINTHEGHHTSSWNWFQQAQTAREQISAPLILLAEIAAALSRGLGNPALAHQVIQQLWYSKIIDLAPVTPKLARRAAAVAADHQIRGCDAVYVALAEQLGDYLITLDQQQLERGAVVITTRRP